MLVVAAAIAHFTAIALYAGPAGLSEDPAAAGTGRPERGEQCAAARVLAESFLDDPVASRDRPRRRRHRRVASPLSFGGIVAASHRHGGRVALARRARRSSPASASAFDPGRWPLGEGAVVHELGLGCVAGPAPDPARHRLRSGGAGGTRRTPHIYLWFLGVDPAAQGSGVGRALLADAPCASRQCAASRPTSRRGKMSNVACYGSAATR